jgi:hypothetical protein
MWLAAASAIAVATPARADDGELPTIDSVHPAAIRIEAHDCRAQIERIALDVHGAAVSWLTIELATRQRFCDRARLELDVPAGTRIAGMAVSAGGARSWSAARPRREAIAAARRETDASLLEWLGSSADQDHLLLEVEANARIEIALELPALARLAIEPVAQRVERIEASVDGRRLAWQRQASAVEIDLRGIAGHVARDAYPHLDADIWLVAGAPDRDESEVSRRFATPPERWGGARLIRKLFKRNRERITYCYERVAQWRGGIEGTVMLHILFGSNGTVTSVTSDSALPRAITSCLESVVATLELGELDAQTLVNYPIKFQMYE